MRRWVNDLGRNARFASIGNGMTAAVMGVTGSYLSSRAVFWLTAALCVPALLSLSRDRPRQYATEQITSRRWNWSGLAETVQRQAAADLRRLRHAVPHVERGHAAAGRRRGDHAGGRDRQPDHRRLHHGAAGRGRAGLALGRPASRTMGPAADPAARLGRAAGARGAAGGAARAVPADRRAGDQRRQRRGVRRDAALARRRPHARHVAFQPVHGRAGAGGGGRRRGQHHFRRLGGGHRGPACRLLCAGRGGAGRHAAALAQRCRRRASNFSARRFSSAPDGFS